MLFALAGNQNCGKTTLFNQLTGLNQHVGNFPGVTVQAKIGRVRGKADIRVVDLPGVYSLSAYSGEEAVARDFLLNEKPDCIINIVDATNIERNLYLTLQLIELDIPIVIALNMMDELYSNGGDVKLYNFQNALGTVVVPICASRNIGLNKLIDMAMKVTTDNRRCMDRRVYTGEAGKVIRDIHNVIKAKSEAAKISGKFAAVKLLEGDYTVREKLGLSDNEALIANEIILDAEARFKTDGKTVISAMRYKFIEDLCRDTYAKGDGRTRKRDEIIDGFLLNKKLAIPMFLGIMLFTFYLTFSITGGVLNELVTSKIALLKNAVDILLIEREVSPVIISLVNEGVFGGVGAVLSFIPTIAVLFFFLSLLEDSGYMARAAFIMDRPFGRLGLSGRSFVPLLMGVGCTVPAIMATRTLKDERERYMTVRMLPFISCSAKLPIYAIFTTVFFKRYRALVMMGMYLFGILVGILSLWILKERDSAENHLPFIMELPHYRLPRIRNTLLLLWDKIRDFISRAFTVLFLTSIIVWVLKTFGIGFNVVSDSGQSILAYISRGISPLFVPLGFNDWRAAAALVTGFSAKEAVVSTLTVLSGADASTLPAALAGMFSPVSALSFMVFTLLYTPCVAAVNTVRCELGSNVAAFNTIAYQTGIAWLCAAFVYQIGMQIQTVL